MYQVGRDFIEGTKLFNLQVSGEEEGLTEPPLEKDYKKENLIDLPNYDHLSDNELHEIIAQRRSVRKYSNEDITESELSYLLWSTQGVKKLSHKTSANLRTVPSAGARHPMETYLLINRVSNMTPGIYRYIASEHKLIPIKYGQQLLHEISDASFGQKFVESSAVTFIWSAVPARSSWRYSERAYRYILLDVGHVCQNLYLSAESIGCGTCAIGAFDDDDLNDILGLDGVEELVIYLASVGKKKE